MVRQYIGARYVPKFYENSAGTSEWRAGVMYEPLTIVTYNGNSYTSKKAVPAEIGDPSNNPSYWVATGMFNQQLADLTDRVDAAEQTVDQLSDKVTAVTAGKVLCVGDSYVTWTREPYSWARKLADIMGKTVDTDLFIAGESGKGFTTTPVNFQTIIADFVSSYTGSLDEFSLVLIGGGANDITDGGIGNIVSTIGSCVAYVKAHFVNAEIAISNCNAWITTTYNYQRREDLNRYYQIGALNHGVKYLGDTGYGCILYPSAFLEVDEKHPTEAGSTDIAQRMFAGLMSYPVNGGPMTSDGITYRDKNDNIFFWWGVNKTYVLPEAIASLTANGGTEISLATTCTIKQSNSLEFFMINGAVRANGVWHMCNMRARFGSGEILVAPWILDGSGSPTLTNIDWVSIPGGNGGRVTGHTLG